MQRTERSVVFKDAISKAKWLDGMATLDARLPLVREITARFAKAYGPNDPEKMVRPWHRFCRDTIRYVKDGPGEELSDSQQTLEKGRGDCDDKARLFVAGVRSMGACPARIVPCFVGDQFKHVQAEVLLPVLIGFRAKRVPVYDRRWVRAELIVQGVELGHLPPRGKIILA